MLLGCYQFYDKARVTAQFREVVARMKTTLDSIRTLEVQGRGSGGSKRERHKPRGTEEKSLKGGRTRSTKSSDAALPASASGTRSGSRRGSRSTKRPVQGEST